MAELGVELLSGIKIRVGGSIQSSNWLIFDVKI